MRIGKVYLILIAWLRQFYWASAQIWFRQWLFASISFNICTLYMGQTTFVHVENLWNNIKTIIMHRTSEDVTWHMFSLWIYFQIFHNQHHWFSLMFGTTFIRCVFFIQIEIFTFSYFIRIRDKLINKNVFTAHSINWKGLLTSTGQSGLSYNLLAVEYNNNKMVRLRLSITFPI